MTDLTDAVVLKQGNAFLVCDTDGRPTLGLFRDDCRFLSALAGAPLRWELPAEDRAVAYASGGGTLEAAADFRPMLALRGLVDLPAADVAVEPVAGGLRLAARGADGVLRTTTLTGEPPPRVDGTRIAFDGELRLTVRLHEDGRHDSAPQPPAPPRLHTGDERVDRVLAVALADLALLRSHIDGDPYYAAGVPWFATLFGRDSLIAALQTLALDRASAAGTLRALAARIGTREDPEREEQPGKILHELRTGEVATLGLSPLTRYYGSVDSTPLFLCLLAQLPELIDELRPAAEAALGWIDSFQGGLLTYAQHSAAGLRNQGWKDSPAGVPVEPPVALIEPQAYAIAAKRGLAPLFGGERGRALLAEADALAAQLERFWLPERNCYALALDGAGRPSPLLASNQGHLLWAGAVSPERAQAIRDALMGPELFSGWGIRTLGTGEPDYDPLGYHVGSVWPHDTALCAAGLRRYGFEEDFRTLTDALVDAAEHFGGHLPELFGGHPREPGRAPVPYPVACRPQAWAAGALPYLQTL